MKIYLITSRPQLSRDQEKHLKEIGNLIIINAAKLTSVQVIQKASDADILIAGSSGFEKLDDKIIFGLKNLKFISLLTVGFNWVDLESAGKRNIPVSNIKGANSESVAEHTWGMILDLSKRITEFDRDVRAKGAYIFGNYQGKEVYKKTIGIIGLGDVGKKVAQISQGFDMKILGINKSQKPVLGVEIIPFNILLKTSDIIVICAPFTKETENLIDEKEINQMKNNVILVNCSREKIVNKEAVLRAIKRGKIFGYGLETEIMKFIPSDDQYLKSSRIIVTPHNAFNTEEANFNSYELAIDNINAFLKGKPQNVIV